jgi:hypothetical protein
VLLDRAVAGIEDPARTVGWRPARATCAHIIVSRLSGLLR